MDAAELPIAVADAEAAAAIAPATIIGSDWSHADVPDMSPETSTTENCGQGFLGTPEPIPVEIGQSHSWFRQLCDCPDFPGPRRIRRIVLVPTVSTGT